MLFARLMSCARALSCAISSTDELCGSSERWAGVLLLCSCAVQSANGQNASRRDCYRIGRFENNPDELRLLSSPPASFQEAVQS